MNRESETEDPMKIYIHGLNEVMAEITEQDLTAVTPK